MTQMLLRPGASDLTGSFRFAYFEIFLTICFYNTLVIFDNILVSTMFTNVIFLNSISLKDTKKPYSGQRLFHQLLQSYFFQNSIEIIVNNAMKKFSK